ncbi:hypothetical protein D3C84_566220 [compost metagenome]
MDPPGADRRDHHGRLRFLPDAGRRARPGQPGHRRVRRHAAVPAGRAVRSLLADRQPSRLYRRIDGGGPGLAGDHAVAAGGQSAGVLHTAAEHDLCARRHQLAHGGDCLAGRQRTDIHAGLAVHQRQHRRSQCRRSVRGGQRAPSAAPRTARRLTPGVRHPTGQALGRQGRAKRSRASLARPLPAVR